MITYVNTVFVSNATDGALATDLSSIKKGQFIVVDENGTALTASTIKDASRIKIGMGTGEMKVNVKTGKKEIPGIKWSNMINVADIKSYAELEVPSTPETEDTVTIDFTGVNSNLMAKFAEGGIRIITRLTFKDLPTRFRKWTESYEYVTAIGDDAESIAENIAADITRQYKRARVNATASAGVVTIEAMPYDDDNAVDTLNWAAKVRFNANVYYTNPAADGWEANNKHFPQGLKIEKTPGFQYPATGKLVRDREAQGMGYEGILNRGECTWPIIKPAMNTDIEENYNAITLEFENMYRAADDIFRKTKQAVEIYCSKAAQFSALKAVVSAAVDSKLVNNTDMDSLPEERV